MEIRNVIKTWERQDCFLSTHIMQEVELFIRVIIINNGKIVTDKKLDNLISEDKEQVIEVEFDFQVEEQLISKIENLVSCKRSRYDVELTFKSKTCVL
jgi:ABC-2 type transport system ATP-binding protein